MCSSREYYLEVTPAGWTFSIWSIIYTLEALWVGYTLVNVFCRGPRGTPYADPLLVPYTVIVASMVACMLNIAWLIVFDRQIIWASALVLNSYSLIFYYMLAHCYISLDEDRLAEQGRTLDIWLTRILVHNGIAMQATWVSIATLLNYAMVTIYTLDPGLSVTDGSTMSLLLLAGAIVTFTLTDLVWLDRYSRYTVTPYLVLVMALTGSWSKNYVPEARNSLITVILLGFSVFLLITKLLATCVRVVRDRRSLVLLVDSKQKTIGVKSGEKAGENIDEKTGE